MRGGGPEAGGELLKAHRGSEPGEPVRAGVVQPRPHPHVELHVVEKPVVEPIAAASNGNTHRDRAPEQPKRPNKVAAATLLIEQVKAMIGISVRVEVREPGSIERSIGKAKRVIDKRTPGASEKRLGDFSP